MRRAHLFRMCVVLAIAGGAVATARREAWTQSYNAGYTDDHGAYAGGSEIMHLVGHKGRLYAANGYWSDARWARAPYEKRQSAQVLRLDTAGGRWQVDLDMGATPEHGVRYMKGNILKSVTFTRDGRGGLLPRPRDLLIAASRGHQGSDGVVSIWVRDDDAGGWRHGIAQRGSRADGSRWVPRDMQVYRDKVTGAERLFLLLGDPGILSGVYDPAQPTDIRWDERVEFPPSGRFQTRSLGIVEANGALLFCVGGVIYKRIDGEAPTYTKVLDLGDDVNTDLGGLRGLTAIANPNGPGESVLCLWVPRGNAAGQIKRLDPDGAGGYTVHDEANLRDLMRDKLGVDVRGVLGAYNEMYAVKHPVTGETVHLIGFQGTLQASDELMWKPTRFYAGALYAIRRADQTYTVREVNGPYEKGKPILVAPRTFAASPFGQPVLYVGGHDTNFKPSDDMAWIFTAPLDEALGPATKR